MKYTVRHMNNVREAFGSYGYIISCDGIDIAHFWHNYRGECEKINMLHSGYSEDPPFGTCPDVLTGGGPLPLGLTKDAEAYLDRLVGRLSQSIRKKGRDR